MRLSKKEREFLCKVHRYVQGDVSRPLFYMDINELAREIEVNKDDVYAISQTLKKEGLIDVEVAGYLEVISIRLTPSSSAYVKMLKRL